MTDITPSPVTPPAAVSHDDSDDLEATIPLPHYRPERLI